jgi:hypothetical protein
MTATDDPVCTCGHDISVHDFDVPVTVPCFVCDCKDYQQC